ncbi:MAG: hypothetical protein GF313_07500 [Caldithrix sp.]|nr:hypothetical protein [Caldithrix sp.]
MKINFFCIILFIFVINSTAKSILHLNIGSGKYGGITTVPYEKPFLTFDGYFVDLEFETFITSNRSLSFYTRYANYNKSELLFNKVESKALYFGIFLNFSDNFLFQNLFYEYSPKVAYGQENINWNDELHSILSTSSPDSIRGKDKLKYLSIGFRGSIGYRISIIIIKLSLGPSYDFLLVGDRKILQDTQEGEKVYKLSNPDYKSRLYIQGNISIGFILF